MPRKLRTWNGRGDYRDFDGRFYVCATTKKRAVELLSQAGHAFINMREFSGYYSECWGKGMETVTPEEGVWFSTKEEDYSSAKTTPKRLI